MTVSTVKKNKQQGPFRTGFLIALSLISLLTFVYLKFFFDLSMKKTLEWSIGKFHGAEVNIEEFKTSFLDASLKIKKIELTDLKNPSTNLLLVGEVNFRFLWDALLRGKFVIIDSSIDEISLYTKRSHKGEVYPKENSLGSNETLQEGKVKTLNVVKEKFEGNALGDIAKLLDGVDSKTYTNELKDNLETQKKVKEIEELVQLKEDEWKKRVDNLPKEDEFKDLANRIKNVKIDKNPLKAIKQISDLGKAVKEGNEKVKEYSRALKDIKTDIKRIESEYNGIDKVIEKDLNGFKNKFSVPNLDAKSLSIALFSQFLNEDEEKIKKYISILEEYLPKKDVIAKNKAKQLSSKERQTGLDRKFPITTSYPLFWLKSMKISSKSTDDGLSGDIKGELTNLTSNPRFVNKVTKLFINGDFPKKNYTGLSLNLDINHHLAEKNEKISFSIKSFPVKNKVLSKSEKIKLSLVQANSRLRIEGMQDSKGIVIKIRDDFDKASFLVETSSSKTQNLLDDILKDINSAYLLANAKGADISQLNWDIESNLGKKVSSSLKNVLNKKIENIKKKYKKNVEDKIYGEKEKLKQKIDRFKNKYKEQIDKEKKKLDKQVEDLDKSVKGKSQNKSKSLESKAKKKLKDLFKGF